MNTPWVVGSLGTQKITLFFSRKEELFNQLDLMHITQKKKKTTKNKILQTKESKWPDLSPIKNYAYWTKLVNQDYIFWNKWYAHSKDSSFINKCSNLPMVMLIHLMLSICFLSGNKKRFYKLNTTIELCMPKQFKYTKTLYRN